MCGDFATSDAISFSFVELLWLFWGGGREVEKRRKYMNKGGGQGGREGIKNERKKINEKTVNYERKIYINEIENKTENETNKKKGIKYETKKTKLLRLSSTFPCTAAERSAGVFVLQLYR